MFDRAVILISLLVGLVLHVTALDVTDLKALGYIDVTGSPYGADSSGSEDSTAAIQKAIMDGMAQEMAVFFPAGTYRISDTLKAPMAFEGRRTTLPAVLVGSTADAEKRATLYLAPNSLGFDDPAKRKVILHLHRKPGNENQLEGKSNTHYDSNVVGLDIKVGPGNAGAVGVRLKAAEGAGIQDMTIDLTESGHTGVWGIPGGGGSAAKITVRGGKIGLDTRSYPDAGSSGTQPTPVVAGLRLIGQTDVAAQIRVRGAMVGVGWEIDFAGTGSPIALGRSWSGEPYDSDLGLIDSVINMPSAPEQTPLIMLGGDHLRSAFLENVFVKGASSVQPDRVSLKSESWTHIKRCGLHVKPEELEVLGKMEQPLQRAWRDGKPVGDELVDLETVPAAPKGLFERHVWADDFPSFESQGAVSVKDFGAVGDGQTDDTVAFRKAVEAAEIVFVPKGDYLLTDTVDLKPETKLIGVHHRFARIYGHATLEKRFGNNADPENTGIPMIRTADVADATTILAHLTVAMGFPLAEHNPTTIGHYSLEWRAGRKSMVRWVDFHPHRLNRYYPGHVATDFFKMEETPDRTYPDTSSVGQKIYCTQHSLIQIRGNGSGRFWNSWLHGNHMFREHVRHILIEGTTEPLDFYHLHTQQQESAYHVEARNAKHISIYGMKCELKAGVTLFDNCDHVRLIGNGGLGTPDPNQGYDHLHKFIDTPNFLIACMGEDINPKKTRWIGANYYRWCNSTLGTYHSFVDQQGGTMMKSPVFERPILYLRGAPNQ